MSAAAQIRPARIDDCPLILELIRALADYERLRHEAVATVADLERSLFGDDPAAEVLIAEADGQGVGFALFFRNYSTFLGKPGLYLEDLFVRPEFRGQGVGLQLIQAVAQRAVERGCGRMEWSVLDWNDPAIGFYRDLGAVPLDDWTVFRLTGAALTTFAGT